MPRLHRFAPPLLVAASLVALAFLPRTGKTVPLYAARTGLMCQSCHFDPNGGGPRNEFGFAYAKNRHSLEPDTTEAWKDLSLKNRVGDEFPLYFGLNQRFMLLGSRQDAPAGDPTDRVGFWNMQNSIFAAFQPHAKLTLVYNLEAVGTSYESRDAFAVIGIGADHYLKAGQFRVPFGLRVDDHTVATRNSFLDYQNQARFLPYDPRRVDRGVELGGGHGNLFARASFTNGTSVNTPPNDQQHPQAVAAKLGYNMSAYQGGLSVYDSWARDPFDATKSGRATRWGYYALAHHGPVALIGELAAGTDQVWEAGAVTRTNSLAGFAEADWAPHRAYNLRLRYDRLELNRSSDEGIDAVNSWNRYALEGEWVPVPFAELRWTMRLIDPVAANDGFGTELKSEKQAYLQLHVSY